MNDSLQAVFSLNGKFIINKKYFLNVNNKCFSKCLFALQLSTNNKMYWSTSEFQQNNYIPFPLYATLQMQGRVREIFGSFFLKQAFIFQSFEN